MGVAPRGKCDELSLRREAEHLVMEQFQLGVLEKFLGAFPLLQHLHQMPQPAVGIGFSAGRAEPVKRLFCVGRILVKRMRRHAALSNLMHQLGADLHFNPHVMRPDHNRMQRAVVILLGRRNVILEAPRNGPPRPVHNANRPVALVHRAHQHAEAENIRELAQRQMFALHLAPNRIGPLLPAIDFRLDAVLRQLGGQRLFNLAQNVAALFVELGKPVLDNLVGIRIEHPEGNVFQLVTHRLHAHASGQRRVDVHGLLGHAQALLWLHMLNGAHVVQPVRQLHHQHPHIL